MSLRSALRNWLRPHLLGRPRLWEVLVASDLLVERARHAVAPVLPHVVKPDPRNLEVAITAHCNLRCVGCKYGRDFMPGSELPWPIVKDLLDDAKTAEFWDVRFYGGEPLLHRDLPKMVAHACAIGLGAYVTTNGSLLKQRIDALYDAGLRTINIGYYGTGLHYDAYVQRKDRFDRLEAGVAYMRERYGSEIRLRINWLLMRPSCNVEALRQAIAFAERYDARLQVDLIHYSLPYFTEGPNRRLQFRAEDRPAIETVVAELLRMRKRTPERFNQSIAGMRSIPEWLLKGAEMRVPCDSHQMIWVGADGTVQQCYVTYRLGNLHQTRLRDLLFTPAHRAYAQDSCALRCPNCHCHYEVRVKKHLPSLLRYAVPRAASIADRKSRSSSRSLPVIQAPTTGA
jgi:molybdenum cofactor biosynthesis enzyme MoaA